MKNAIFAILFMFLMVGCSDHPNYIVPDIEDSYYVPRMSPLTINAHIGADSYEWIKIYDDGSEEIVGTSCEFTFISADEGEFRMKLILNGPEGRYECPFKIFVTRERVEYSPYISEVVEYRPAPGQFINEMPLYEDGDTYKDMLSKATFCIAGTQAEPISLGGFGGYVTFRFDHTIVNVPGKNDIAIFGNAFYDTGIGTSRPGGSCEPGVVMVSLDVNGNGLPDDAWYELAGSAYALSDKNYSITWHRPDPDRQVISDMGNGIVDLYYIMWTDSRGEIGYMPMNMIHTGDYFPKWISENEITTLGNMLPCNAEKSSGHWALYPFEWGYVDNRPSADIDGCSFDISNAMDASGEKIWLPGADFVRVYTGMRQQCGLLGESSTEVTGARDLHL